LVRERLNAAIHNFFHKNLWLFFETFSSLARLTYLNMIMNREHGTSLETRPSLLRRLKTDDDPQSWQEFYQIYGGLIRFFSEKAGLTADEAEEVVQETAIGVARRLPEFIYDPQVCRFKTWLLNLTRWRIQDQIRRRARTGGIARGTSPGAVADRELPSDETKGTRTVERIPDPAEIEFGAEWDAAWQKNLFTQALERVRDRIEERQFQIFDLYVMKDWPPEDVARTLGISIARVYLTKHRVSLAIAKETRRLEKQLEQELTRRTEESDQKKPAE
jgi:RNA polymerase sigma factor (sigma-70 family)